MRCTIPIRFVCLAPSTLGVGMGGVVVMVLRTVLVAMALVTGCGLMMPECHALPGRDGRHALHRHKQRDQRKQEDSS